MKNIFKIIVIGITIMVSSCSKNIFNGEEYLTPSITEENGERISKFTLHKRFLDIANNKEITINLRNINSKELISCKARVNRDNENSYISLIIPKDKIITDGEYHFVSLKENTKRLSNRLKVSFKGEKLNSVAIAELKSSLKGEGKPDNPFLISNSNDFDMFLYDLYKDEGNGFGYYYQQTGSFVAPLKGRDQQGSYYYPQPFAGHYSGSGKETITIQYLGANRGNGVDENIGMFSELTDGAYISNINVNITYSNINSNVGGVAGKSSGHVTLSHINLTGAINNSGSNIGGFIGNGTGTLYINNCSIALNINSGSNVGGAIGIFTDGTLHINNFSNSSGISFNNNYIQLNNISQNCGGAVGYLKNSDATLVGIELKSNPSNVSSNIKMIKCNKNSGGVVGYIELTNNTKTNVVSIKNSTISLPIEGKDYTGGIVGKVQISNSSLTYSKLIISSSKFSSSISGSYTSGGLIGLAELVGIFNLNNCIDLQSTNSIKKSANSSNKPKISNSNSVQGGVFGSITSTTTAELKMSSKTDIHCIIDGAYGKSGSIAGELKNITLYSSNYTIGSDTELYNFGIEYSATEKKVGYTEYGYIR